MLGFLPDYNRRTPGTQRKFLCPFPSTFLHGIEVSPAANDGFYFKLPDISGNEGGL